MQRIGSFNVHEEDDERLAGGNAVPELGRKRTLVRPERQHIDRDHPQFHYQQAATQPDASVTVMPSTTGNEPIMKGHQLQDLGEVPEEQEDDDHQVLEESQPHELMPDNKQQQQMPIMPKVQGQSLWRLYCRALTFPVLPAMMRPFGMKTEERQMAWREKIGLISVILLVGAFVGYLTFGFTATVCKNDSIRVRAGHVSTDNVVISGRVVAAGSYNHPQTDIFSEGTVLYPPVNCGGKDLSMLFQNVNGHCLNVIKPKSGTSIPTDGNKMGWYFPCQVIDTHGNWEEMSSYTEMPFSGYNGMGCHTSQMARNALYQSHNITAYVYFTWEDIQSDKRQLVVYNGDVLNLDYVPRLLGDDLTYPSIYDALYNQTQFKGTDVSQLFSTGMRRREMECLRELTKVGTLDTKPIGCIASSVVLYISLVFIIGLVGIKFLLACYFHFIVARKQGAFPVSLQEMNEQENKIDDWSADPFSQGPIAAASTLSKANKRKSHIGQRLTASKTKKDSRKSTTMVTQNPGVSTSKVIPTDSVMNMPMGRHSMLAPSVITRPQSTYMRDSMVLDSDTSYKRHSMPMDPFEASTSPEIHQGEDEDYEEDFDPSGSPMMGPIGGDSEYWVPQPPATYEPFGYPLAHTMCLVTAYSEDELALRTTLDSISTTDYPNSHKLVTIICDGLVKGSGNELTTPDICLSMMYDFYTPPEDVQAYSYISVVSGSKRHNMAKVYAGFYRYSDETVPPEQQQRIPVLLIVKCGAPAEAGAAKPGNRGKRDSQVILMSFLQRVMFDERMTELDFEIFNGICNITGIAPDYYELMLMVDADTKVFPDCLTHMVAEMVHDPEIMGLCGETKISNKLQSWVTAIQVFEYFISHHQAKAFESCFGNVTCLPGCFSIYRIKSPKGSEGYWVPILANPDIVERYSENVVDTLHKKNLLLLGEDRYLSTLMLRTFPKRKNIFLPRAACKTTVPESFRVLLSQRRRWINSTIHNLMELVLVRDLCGVFIISMQFVIMVDLASTLVLPAAIAFTIYVVIGFIINSNQSPMSLILLGLILGLPGLLIVVTATRPTYVLWMLVYLLALPIWNFVLPMYSYWKFDDFSWGDTRKISGGDKSGHGDAEGEFDSSRIVMKRWREFQRDRDQQL